MLVNEPNIILWANRCYNLAHKVRETSMATRTNKDGRGNQSKPQHKRHPSKLDEDVGKLLDFEA